MSIKEKIYQHFRRKTNTTSFIPQIDGLRFLVIIISPIPTPWIIYGIL
ncbi:MAG: hypothetical protein P4L74_03330 [Candidatus Doudnabacteria bacterium]|nr:hypothetical protein [Candidatus Doudnabacteria bacterium]